MYIPYRKAQRISGMNPLMFVTVFTFGELGFGACALHRFRWRVSTYLAAGLVPRPSSLFWLFFGRILLGSWATSFSSTPPSTSASAGAFLFRTPTSSGVWRGARWCFAETAGMDTAARALILGGSVIVGFCAWAISSAEAPGCRACPPWSRAIERECLRYGLKQDVERDEILEYTSIEEHPRRSWPELLVLCVAVGIFVWLAAVARPPAVEVNPYWAEAVLIAASLAFLIGAGSAAGGGEPASPKLSAAK